MLSGRNFSRYSFGLFADKVLGSCCGLTALLFYWHEAGNFYAVRLFVITVVKHIEILSCLSHKGLVQYLLLLCFRQWLIPVQFACQSGQIYFWLRHILAWLMLFDGFDYLSVINVLNKATALIGEFQFG